MLKLDTIRKKKKSPKQRLRVIVYNNELCGYWQFFWSVAMVRKTISETRNMKTGYEFNGAVLKQRQAIKLKF